MKKLVALYLNHLKLAHEKPSLEYLRQLQQTHIQTIPHENIDGIYNIHSAFAIPHLLNKFIVEKRGGMCFELNYAFAWLLHQLGFKVEIILADVHAYDYSKEKNKYPTHPVIIVDFDGHKFLTDVGWSDSYRQPLALTSKPYTDGTGTYQVASTSDDKLVMQKLLLVENSTNDYVWHDQFVFAKPQGPFKEFTFPKGFLTAHAFTHIGKGYIFTTLFHFTKVNEHGHSTIWDNKLLIRQGEIKSNKTLTKDIADVLQNDFNIDPEVAKKCVKMKRSNSCLFSYKAIQADDVVDLLERRRVSKTAPF